MVIKEKDKISFLSLIKARLICSNIDLKELGNDSLNSPYRNLRPYGGSCECWGGIPEEEKVWHITHLNKCVKSYKQLGELRESLWNLIVQEGKRFKKEKKQVWKRIKEKARKLGFGSISGELEIMSCTNKKLLKDKEDSKLAYLENLANTWQKNSEAEKEKVKSQEEERIKQERQKVQAEEAKRRQQEEEIRQKEQEFKKQFEEEQRKNNNQSTNNNDEPTSNENSSPQSEETNQNYQDHQEEINNLKKEQATEDPHTYSKEAQQRITQKLAQNQVKIEDLSSENQQDYQKLKDGQIQDPNQLVETETKIKQNIYQVETEKKVINFTSRVNQVLKEKLTSQITTLKKELLAFTILPKRRKRRIFWRS